MAVHLKRIAHHSTALGLFQKKTHSSGIEIIKVLEVLDLRRVLPEFHRGSLLQLAGPPAGLTAIGGPERGLAGKVGGPGPKIALQRENRFFLPESEVPPFSSLPIERDARKEV